MTDYKALYEKERKKKESYCRVIKKQQETIKELKKRDPHMFVATTPSVIQKYREEIEKLKEELRNTKEIVWEQEKIEEMGVEEYIKRQSLQGNIPEYNLITYDEPIDYDKDESPEQKVKGTNELHIFELKEQEGDNYKNGPPIMMCWDWKNEILDEFFNEHYSINDIYNHYFLDMRWLEFIKKKWDWKPGTKLRFSTKNNSDGYMNFWRRDDDMRCDFIVDENGVFCSHLDYKYYSDDEYIAINCMYNQAIKDIKEDLRKKEDIEELKNKLKKIKQYYDEGELSDSWILNDDYTITLEYATDESSEEEDEE
jgi:hypothetical protein